MTGECKYPPIDLLVDAKNSYHTVQSDMGRAEARLIVCQSDIIADIDIWLIHMLIKVRNGEGGEIEPELVMVSKYVRALRRSMGP